MKPPPFLLSGWIGWISAAALAVGAGLLAQLYLNARAELAATRTDAALARIDARSARNHLEAERLLVERQTAALQRASNLGGFKIAALGSRLDDVPQAQGLVVWNPESQEGLLEVALLPPLAAGQVYRLWLVDPQYPNPVDGGAFTADPKTGVGRHLFRPAKPVQSVVKFAVSLERADAASRPGDSIVLATP